MLNGFDFLGPLKWPSLAAVSVIPAVCFAWFWGDFDRAQAMRVYGPASVGSTPILLTAPAAADASDPTTRWCARTCADCAARVSSLELGYGGERAAPVRWATAEPDQGRACVDLPRPTVHRQFIWVRVADQSGRNERAWPL